MNIKITLYILLFFLNCICFAQTTNNNMTTTDNDSTERRLPNTVSIEIPITALLEITKDGKCIIASLTFTNTSDKDVLIDRNKLGGDKLRNRIFSLSPWYNSNLTFKPYSSFFFGNSVDEDYIVIKPNEIIYTHTNLSKYYDFNEREYDKIDIVFLAVMKYLDENHQQIYSDRYDEIKPVDFDITSNRVTLEYKDIVK